MSAKKNKTKHAVTIYTRYERFWHWSQAGLIFFLFFTGLHIHGTLSMMSFGKAVTMHTYAAILLITLWVFTTFWNFTTGNWLQFLPFFRVQTPDGKFISKVKLFFARLWAVIRYYGWGILKGEEHPHKKTLRRKQNALQALAYLTFMVLIGPALWFSGVVYLLYDFWEGVAGASTLLTIVAFVHTAAAFAIIAFAIIHVYMTTTGKTVFHYIKTMITGVENIELDEIEKAYLEKHHPERMNED